MISLERSRKKLQAKESEEEKSDEINNSISEELEKLNELFKSGAISEEDFQKAKKKILD